MIFLSILTEYYFTSPGVSERKEHLRCLGNYLKSQNVKISIGNSNLTENCMEIVDQWKQKIMNDTENELYAAYNVSTFSNSSLVDESKKFTSDLQSTSDICMHVKEAKSPQKNLEEVAQCLACIKGNSQSATNDYKNAMLHAIAVNFTVIEFRLWEYFQVSSKVEKLLNDANALKLKTVNDCETMRKCKDLKSY